jgi:hypothetical protein
MSATALQVADLIPGHTYTLHTGVGPVTGTVVAIKMGKGGAHSIPQASCVLDVDGVTWVLAHRQVGWIEEACDQGQSDLA